MPGCSVADSTNSVQLCQSSYCIHMQRICIVVVTTPGSRLRESDHNPPPPCSVTMFPRQQKQHTGQVIHRINQITLSIGAEHKAVKSCFDQAARQVFQGHGTVQSQGSTSKGTAIRGLSDWDFIVRLTAGHPTVTQQERMLFLQYSLACMAAKGINYTSQPGQNRIKFSNGTHQGQALPEIDICFKSFKGVPKLPPNNRAMAGTYNGHQVVRYIKALPVMYTNLPEPKSMYVEDLVMKIEQQIKKDARQPGSMGLHTLLTASLQAISQQQYKQVLQLARLDSVQWQDVACKVLNKQQATGQWHGLS